MVLSWAELRNERATEIMAQIDPQYAFWSSIVYMHPDRTKRTFELINIVLQFCVYVEMRFKHALACWRPVEYNAEVQPMITTPGHGTFPMGHATQAYAVAHMLKALLNLDPREPRNTNGNRPARPPGGTHRDQPCHGGSPFPGRQHGGTHVGRGLGRVLRRAMHGKTAQTFKSRTFIAATGIDSAPTTDFNPFKPIKLESRPESGPGKFYSESAGGTVTQSDLMAMFGARRRRSGTADSIGGVVMQPEAENIPWPRRNPEML